MRNRAWAALALSLIVVAGAACSDSSGDASSGADEPAVAEQHSGDGGGGGGSHGSARALTAAGDSATTYDAVGQVNPPAAEPDLPLAEERVIKTADLRLEVEDGTIGRTLREGREIAEAAGGFLLATSIEGTDRRSGEFTIRVPAGRFEEALSALEALGDIAGEDVRGEDVSQEFVDLEARLRNATAQEGVLFRLYDRSQSIADTIRVQRELEDVQLEIERLRGRLRYLEDRTDLSTISVSVTEAGAVAAEPGPFARAWENARDTFVAVVSGAIVGAGFLLPLLVLALVAYALFRIVRPRLGKTAATPAE
ncbi:MAG: DUF4349 domain-containing protein [Actinomycetota bacterium]|nr:DUF4349 domain-containing protein [Actinomycetota bacterium]